VIDLELSVGDFVILIKGRTIVDGEVSGWMVAGGQIVHLFIAEIEQPFRLVGEDAWKVAREEEENEVQPK
jgi:hypothetical protein